MAQIVAGIYCKLYHYLYTKWAENFDPCTSITKCVIQNISVSAQPFFLLSKGHSTRNWTTNHIMDYTIMELSDDIKIGPESLLVVHP